jgi:hypothetical protein
MKLIAALIFISAVTSNSARSESFTMPDQQKEILCAVAIAGEFGYSVKDLRAFTTVARGCVELSNVEKYGAVDVPSERCLPTLQRAREAMDGRPIAIDEQAITDLCLNVMKAKSFDEKVSPQGKDAYIEDVRGNAIFRSAFCQQKNMSGRQCVLFYRELAGHKPATQ